jgi:hypothetical protein
VNSINFWIFETFCEDAPHNKLRGKKKFVFFRPTDQKLWVFEVFRQSSGSQNFLF